MERRDNFLYFKSGKLLKLPNLKEANSGGTDMVLSYTCYLGLRKARFKSTFGYGRWFWVHNCFLGVFFFFFLGRENEWKPPC